MAKVSGLTWDQALVCMTKNLNHLSKWDLWDGQSRRFCLGWSALPFTCSWANHACHHSTCERIQQKVMRDPFIINALCKYDRDFLFSQDRLAHTQLNGSVWTHPKVKHSSKKTEKKQTLFIIKLHICIWKSSTPCYPYNMIEVRVDILSRINVSNSWRSAFVKEICNAFVQSCGCDMLPYITWTASQFPARPPQECVRGNDELFTLFFLLIRYTQWEMNHR